jgi:hypothetical protein
MVPSGSSSGSGNSSGIGGSAGSGYGGGDDSYCGAREPCAWPRELFTASSLSPLVIAESTT